MTQDRIAVRLLDRACDLMFYLGYALIALTLLVFVVALVYGLGYELVHGTGSPWAPQ